MRSWIALLLLVCFSSQAAPGVLDVLSTTPLQGDLAEAVDLRWNSDHEVVLAAGRKGVFRFDTVTHRSQRVLGGSGRDGFFYSARLGLSRNYVVPGSSFAALAFMRNEAGATISPQIPFDMILDLDVYGDRLAVLGGRRANDGRWAPEGAIVWVGTLSKGLRDLEPLHYSETGPGARALDRCHYFNTGAVRFLRDGSLVVAPAVERGVFVYDPSGKLVQTWDDDPLGFQNGCGFSEKESHELATQPAAQWRWMNARTILDDIVPVPGGIGIFTRRFAKDGMHWTLSIFRDGKVEKQLTLPFVGGERSFVRADIRGGKIAVLLIEYATAKTPDGARLAILELR